MRLRLGNNVLAEGVGHQLVKYVAAAQAFLSIGMT
jgi:hypothetical protein